MQVDMFCIPFFIGEVDLSKIKITHKETEKIWLSQVESSFGKENIVDPETYEYLQEKFLELMPPELIGGNPRFGEVWRNKYTKTDWQDIHIHPHSQWSFVIYEDVEQGKTVFMNPNYKLIQNQIGTGHPWFPLDFRPECKTGDIVIFPSMIEHFVMTGNEGTTISGNIYMDY